MANLGDIYVNDAFGTVHRKHASTAVIAKFFPKNKYFGLLLNNEINSLEKALDNPKRPFTAIIGGAKISGKIDVITALFEKVGNLISDILDSLSLDSDNREKKLSEIRKEIINLCALYPIYNEAY